MEVLSVFYDLLSNRKHTRWLLPLLLAAEALLCALIIWKVPYTEIDWQAYMEQVSSFLDGERDYTKIKGGTGPLVYPAFHVYIYTGLYYLTDQGRDILNAQIIFAGVYLASLGVVIKCYQAAKVPPYILPMLLLSKRMHSIFLLRCFNDCFAVAALFIAIYAFQRRMWTIGCLVYSIGLGVKMSLLLVLPALGVVLIQAVGAQKALRLAGLIAQLQFVIALPFLQASAAGYRSRAFEFTRQFLFKWTVNWRFVGEETFLSQSFSIGLLAAHFALLLLFFTTRWANPSEEFGMHGSVALLRSLFIPVPSETQRKIASHVTPKYIMTTVLSANTIGMLCARSLHYQFFSWTAWATPFLLWQSGWHPLVLYALWAAQEWAWNVYPSTSASSITVVGVLGLTITGVWWGTRSSPKDKLGKRPEHVE